MTLPSNGFTSRKRFSTTLDKDLVSELEELYTTTKIPKARLLDEAIADLIQKYEKRMVLYKK